MLRALAFSRWPPCLAPLKSPPLSEPKSDLPDEAGVFAAQDAATLDAKLTANRDVDSVVDLDVLRNPSPYRKMLVSAKGQPYRIAEDSLQKGLALISAIYRKSGRSEESPDCGTIGLAVAEQVKLHPSEVLEIVEREVGANPDCSCEVVKAAITASDADVDKVVAIAETAITASPESMRIISQCAIAAMPESIASVQALLAKLDPNAGESGYSSKGAKSCKDAKAKVASIIAPPLPNPLDLPPHRAAAAAAAIVSASRHRREPLWPRALTAGSPADGTCLSRPALLEFRPDEKGRSRVFVSVCWKPPAPPDSKCPAKRSGRNGSAATPQASSATPTAPPGPPSPENRTRSSCWRPMPTRSATWSSTSTIMASSASTASADRMRPPPLAGASRFSGKMVRSRPSSATPPSICGGDDHGSEKAPAVHELWVDVGASNPAEVAKLGIRVGHPAVYQRRPDGTRQPPPRRPRPGQPHRRLHHRPGDETHRRRQAKSRLSPWSASMRCRRKSAATAR